jgi:hypothetical protein
MNPLGRCPKGYKKCIKNCHEPNLCTSCPYLKECCRRYCVIFPMAKSRAINEINGPANADSFVECIEFILRRHL